jgi:hypothetical protein
VLSASEQFNFFGLVELWFCVAGLKRLLKKVGLAPKKFAQELKPGPIVNVLRHD